MEKITKDHPLSKSEDILQSNIETLKSLFPTIVKEGKIDLKELEALLSDEIETSDEYYRFNWAGKSDARREANKPSTATLRPAKEESKNWDTTENIFIEGDNLEVLKLLQKSYTNQVKMIYIDPPYNTGKDFVYKDNYADNLGNYLSITGQVDEEGKRTTTNTESDGRYHSNWLNMMYPRLKLARNLLKDDGVILISIDDKEVHNLRKLCDEIFGEDNFLANLIWSFSSGSQAGYFTGAHEYVLVYTKNKSKLKYFTDNGGGIIKHGALKKISAANPASEILFEKGSITFEGNDATFEGELGGSEKQFIVDGVLKFKNGLLDENVTIRAGWAMKNQVLSWLKGEETVDSKGQKVSKFYFNSQGILFYEKERGTVHPKTVLPGFVGTTKKASEEIMNLIGSKVMDFPKPSMLLEFLIKTISQDSNDIIVDFFAGSGTTAHATYLLNSTDGLKRKFITVQLPEITSDKSEAFKEGFKTIAQITKQRIRKAGEKIKQELEDKILSEKQKELTELNLESADEEMNKLTTLQLLDNLDTGFKVFKLDTSNINSWDGSVANFELNLLNTQTNIKIDRTEEDVLFEVLLKYGLNLTVPIEEKTINKCNVYSVGLGTLFVCLSDNITTEVAEEIGRWKEKLNPTSCRILFKDNGFKDDVAKTNSIQILKRFAIQEINSL